MKIDLDDPNIPYGIKLYYKGRVIAPYIAHAILGLIAWFLLYGCMAFFKDYFICYVRKDEKFNRGFYYKLVEYKPYIKKISIFFGMVLGMWAVIFFLEWRYYTFFAGLLLFLTGYTIFAIKYYLIDDNEFDLFTDTIWLMQYLFKRKEKIKEKTE